ADSSREKRSDGSVPEIGKKVSIFQKELSPLRKEELETIQIGLLDIDVDLRKVRIDSQVQVQRRGKSDFDVTSNGRLVFGGGFVLVIPRHAGCSVGDDRNIRSRIGWG